MVSQDVPIAVVAVLVASLILEIFLRTYRSVWRRASFFMTYPVPSPKSLSFEEHPYALYVKKPNSEGLYPSNSLGYSGKREFSKKMQPNSVRIYCVGGSTVEQH